MAIRKKVFISNKLGLHARAAAKLIHLTNRYASEINLIKHDQKVNGKSIMGVMMLAASKGTELEIVVTGCDESEAACAVESLIANRFGELE